MSHLTGRLCGLGCGCCCCPPASRSRVCVGGWVDVGVGVGACGGGVSSQAAGSWGKAACCAADRSNYCPGSYCVHKSLAASNDFTFRLSPGTPQRFMRKPSSNRFYQYAFPGRWPMWGTGDLELGDGGVPGTHGRCSRFSPPSSGTYTARANEVCGGYEDWGATDLEVWHPVVTVRQAAFAVPVAADVVTPVCIE
jgi:hypothetical protein